VHIKTLRRVGMEVLRPGQEVRIRVGQGPKGPQVAEIDSE
jgi:CspA family cold shock protein